jgi:hypothetical protein
MNIYLKNATVCISGGELKLLGIEHTIICDEKTAHNLREHFCPTKPPCPAMSDNTYASVCKKDKQPCNGDFQKCRMLERAMRENAVQNMREEGVL